MSSSSRISKLAFIHEQLPVNALNLSVVDLKSAEMQELIAKVACPQLYKHSIALPLKLAALWGTELMMMTS